MALAIGLTGIYYFIIFGIDYFLAKNIKSLATNQMAIPNTSDDISDDISSASIQEATTAVTANFLGEVIDTSIAVSYTHLTLPTILLV